VVSPRPRQPPRAVGGDPALLPQLLYGKKEAILMDMEKGLSELMVILKSSVQH
jgi:hypothetical protein